MKRFWITGSVLAIGLMLVGCSGTEEAGEVEIDPSVVRIASMGDSIAAGQCAYTDNRGDQVPGEQVYSYRFYLQEHLNLAGFELGVEYDFVGRNRGPFLGCGVIEPILGNEATVSGTQPIPGFGDIQHEGWPGATAAQLTERISGGIGEPIPDLILLQIGTNDIFAMASQLELPWEPTPELVAAFDADLRDLIAAIRSINSDVTIAWATVPPCGFEFGFCDNPVIPINDTIRALATELTSESSPIVLVDHFAVFDVAETWDAIHPTNVGDRLMADTWWESIRPLVTDLVAEKALLAG